MRNTKLIILVTLLILCVVSLFAQTNGVPDITPTDEAIRDQLAQFSWLKIFIVPITTVIVMGLRKVISAIPIQLWPWVTPFIGTALDYAGAKFGFWTGNVEAGLAVGALAVWFHQLTVQTKNLASEGPKPSSG